MSSNNDQHMGAGPGDHSFGVYINTVPGYMYSHSTNICACCECLVTHSSNTLNQDLNIITFLGTLLMIDT